MTNDSKELYTYPCGCSFRVVGPPPLPKSEHPAIELDWDKVPLDCKATYDLLSTGKSRLVFQLELGAGRQGCKELKPENIEHLTALASVLRPGSANNLDAEGISTTKHYYRRKNGEEPTVSYHPVLDPILGSTYQCQIFQEQSTKIAEAIAGFNKTEADNLRRAIGKKKADEMAKVKTMFIEGAKREGVVTEKQAEEIFGWIRESVKYSFNRSHAVSYSITSYQCAYAKTHFPVEAYTQWLRWGQDKAKPLEEYAVLVDDAKLFNIDVFPPDIIDLRVHFYTDGEKINYGISNVKGIGENTARKIITELKEIEKTFKPIREWTWYDLLTQAGDRFTKTCMNNLISVGAFRNIIDTPMRSQALKEFEAFDELKPSELKWAKDNSNNYTNIADLLEATGRPKGVGGCSSEKQVAKLQSRVQLLRNPIVAYRDNPAEIANWETALLGIAITCSIADAKPGERWTVTCKDCTAPTPPKGAIILKVKVEDVREITIKKGKAENIGKVMAFIKISDSTCSLEDISCFADQWENFKNIIVPGQVIEIQLEKSFKGNRLHVKDVWNI
jgi:DNA polymerase III alpha subunit